MLAGQFADALRRWLLQKEPQSIGPTARQKEDAVVRGGRWLDP